MRQRVEPLTSMKSTSGFQSFQTQSYCLQSPQSMAAVQVPPQNIFRHHRPDYESPSKGEANGLLNDREEDFHCPSAIANSTTHHTRRTVTSPPTRRARSLSLSDTGPYDSSHEDINAPAIAPPIVRSLSRYVHSAKAQRKPYERRDPSTLQRRYAASQLSPVDSRTLPDIQKHARATFYSKVDCNTCLLKKFRKPSSRNTPILNGGACVL